MDRKASPLSTPDRAQLLILLGGVIVGLAMSRLTPDLTQAGYILIPPALIIVLYCVMVRIPLGEISAALGKIKPTSLVLAINFLLNPALAWVLGAIFLRHHPELWVGLVMYLVTPCTDWYLIFTQLARGDTALGVALVPWNLILQIVLLPVYLLMLTGWLIPVDLTALGESVALYFLLPLGLALLTRPWLVRWKGRVHFDRILQDRLNLWQLSALTVVIVLMFGSQGAVLMAQLPVFTLLVAPVLMFFALVGSLAQVMGRAARCSYPERALLTCTTAARNSPLALALAVGTFPQHPLIAAVIVIGPMIELPVLIIMSRLLLWMRARIAEPGI